MSLAESDSSIDGLSQLGPPRHPKPRHPKPQDSTSQDSTSQDSTSQDSTSQDSKTQDSKTPVGGTPAAARPTGATNVSQIWLDGDVLACACPDCNAPMTIRLWLCMAECRMCGTQIELTEEQEREAQRLWESRAAAPLPEASTWKLPPRSESPTWSQPLQLKPPPKPAVVPAEQRAPTKPAPPKPTPPKSAPPRTPPPAPSPPAPPLVAEPVIEPPPLPTLIAKPAAPKPPPAAAAPPERWISRSLLQSLISTLVSLLLHMALILILGLWLINRPRNGTMVLHADFRMSGRQEQRVEAAVQVIPKLPTFHPPAPTIAATEVKPSVAPPRTEAKKDTAEAVKKPTAPEVNHFAAGVVRPGTMFAGRDPRIRTDIILTEGGTSHTEEAVSRGLKWIAAHQDSNGGWSLSRFHFTGDCNAQCGPAGIDSDSAATALALLPFLGAGYTHKGGEYKELVQRGLDRLVMLQQVDGSFYHHDRGRMYSHGLAAIALCEAYALTKDRELMEPAQKAIDVIVYAQHREGGWRYYPGMPGDMSVTGWQLMALRSAQNAYLEVPAKTFSQADRFLNEVQTNPSIGTFGYQARHDPNAAMTAEGILSRLYAGTPATDPALLRGADYLLKEHFPSKQDVDLYYWYYGAQALHHLGGERWSRWNNHLRELLVELQEREGHMAGSWMPGRYHDPVGGRLYATALAICTLEVYYRHMPLHRLTAPPSRAKLQ